MKLNLTFTVTVLLLIIISILNLPIINTIWRYSFDDGTYSHAYLIPLMSFYAFYRSSNSGALEFRKNISLIPIVLLTICSYFLLITSTAQISLGYWLNLLLVYIFSITIVYKFNWSTIFPAAFFIFLLPVWGILIEPLQNLSIKAVTFLMGLSNIPIFVENEFIQTPSGMFEIAGGCSGLRYIIVSLAISSMFIFLHIKSPKKAILFFCAAILGALLTNWIRITALIMIGEYTNMQSSLMEDHNMFGWYIFIPFMFLLFRWGNKLVGIEEDVKQKVQPTNKKVLLINIILIVIIIIFSSSTIRNSNYTSEVISDESNLNSISPQVMGYSKREILSSSNKNEIVYYFDGSELDGKPTFFGNQLIPEGWELTEQNTTSNWSTYHVSKDKINYLISYKYEIDGITSNNVSQFKKLRLKKAFSNIRETKLYWTMLPCKTDCIVELAHL